MNLFERIRNLFKPQAMGPQTIQCTVHLHVPERTVRDDQAHALVIENAADSIPDGDAVADAPKKEKSKSPKKRKWGADKSPMRHVYDRMETMKVGESVTFGVGRAFKKTGSMTSVQHMVGNHARHHYGAGKFKTAVKGYDRAFVRVTRVA